MSTSNHPLNLPKNLGNGLLIRLATKTDIENIAKFNRLIHEDEDDPNSFISNWTQILISGKHPTASASDFVLIEDTTIKDDNNNSKIVSLACLIPQIWNYYGIPFGAGQPELVGTDPNYRRRGLIRTIFEVLHQLSENYGHLVQGITGSPWFYRQFGYEYALDLGGSRVLKVNDVPSLGDNETEPYQIRLATLADIPALIKLCHQFSADKSITAQMDKVRWHYELTARDYVVNHYCIIDNKANGPQVVGYYTVTSKIWGDTISVGMLVVEKETSLYRVMPSIARSLKKHGEACLTNQKNASKNKSTENSADKQELKNISFNLGTQHLAYDVFNTKLGPLNKPYAWYMRVPNLIRFIKHITPVLHQRLANSVMCNYSGELKISFYKGGLKLVFKDGNLIITEDWQDMDKDDDAANAAFPPLVFLKLLFGYRSLTEIEDNYPDYWADEEQEMLLKILFPKQQSWLIFAA